MIRLARGNDYVDKFRAYNIFIDDVYRGDIKRNEVKEFEVATGEHIIYAKIDWGRSNKLCVCVNVSNSILELEIGSSITGKKLFIPFILILYATLLRNKYLYIRDKSDCTI